MDFHAAVSKYIKNNLNDLEKNYNWSFKMDGFPDSEYVLSGKSIYTQSRNLRKYINQQIKENANRSAIFQEWYVRNWGGVKGNKKETLEKYQRSDNSELISLKEKGIASWSKILCVRDPQEYAIYDARVAISLNSIQKLYKVSDPILFPLLISRNTSFVTPTQKLIRQSKFFTLKASNDFYSMYLDILKNSVKGSPKFDIQDAEMILFSNAAKLSKEWAPNN
jgi:hypothetical protein